MPLFRFHRGGLDESLKTTIIVKTFNDMVKAILDNAEPFVFEHKWGARFGVAPYPTEEHNFDVRIGWYTQLVTANLYAEDKMEVMGFLSEPFHYDKEINNGTSISKDVESAGQAVLEAPDPSAKDRL